MDLSLSNEEFAFFKIYEADMNTQRDEFLRHLLDVIVDVAALAAKSGAPSLTILAHSPEIGDVGDQLARYGILFFKLGRIYQADLDRG